jgi:hypothetical protein
LPGFARNSIQKWTYPEEFRGFDKWVFLGPWLLVNNLSKILLYFQDEFSVVLVEVYLNKE